MFPYVGEVQILGLKSIDYPAKDNKPAQSVTFVDFYVPNEGAGTARVFEAKDVLKFNELKGKTIKAKISQGLYNGKPNYKLEITA